MKVVSINLNGIRSAWAKGFEEWLQKEKPDFVCAQETRIQDHQLTPSMLKPAGMHATWLHAKRPGYSGVSIWSRQAPDRIRTGLGWPDLDHEGRLLETDFGRFTLVSLYLPSGSSSDDRQGIKEAWMARMIPWLQAKRRSKRHVLICGDWNIAHTKDDLKNWRSNQKNSGFLPQERAWMGQVFGEEGWTDLFRKLHPKATGSGYTWWSNRGRARENNVGWRLDYQVATPGLARRAKVALVHPEPKYSDHAPLCLEFADSA